MNEAHQKLGPIVRLAPSEISINCVDKGIKTVYSGGFEKHEWYPRVFGSLGTVSMFTMVGSKQHSTRKRMLSNIYSKSVLQSSPHMRVISHAIIFDRLLPTIHKASQSGSPIDIHDLGQGLTMDFVSAYLFGLANGTNFLQDQEYRQKMIGIYQSRKPYEFYHQEVPNLLHFANMLGLRLIPEWCDSANSLLDAWNLDMCDKAEKSVSSTNLQVEPAVYKQLKQGMMKQLPREKEEDTESYGSLLAQQRIDIACEMYDHLTAGHETSAIALTYLFWEMSKRHTLQRELHDELMTLKPPVIYTGASATYETPSPKSIDSLPLLDAIVTETLRLHAPIPGIQPRVTPYPTCDLAGYPGIPANTRVNAQAYSLHRNAEVYPEPLSWEPKRWLEDDHGKGDSNLEEMRRWFWAFGSGGRMCVGSNLAIQGIVDTLCSLPYVQVST